MGRRADSTLCHPAMRGDPGIRELLVQAGSLETDWHRDSSGGLREGGIGKTDRKCTCHMLVALLQSKRTTFHISFT